MAIIESKKVEPAKYRWHKVGDTANSVQRRGNGTENWVGLRKENARGQYDCYILVKATLQHSLSLASLKQKLVYGLLKERFEHPNVACKAYWDEQFGPLIRYTPPSDHDKAVLWARQRIEVRATSQTGLELRRQIVSKRKAQNTSSNSFTFYVLSDVPDTDTIISQGSPVEFLVHFNHIYWDGISARLFVGHLLNSVGQDLEHAQYNWGKEVENLSAPLLDSLKIDPQTLGEDYEDSLEEFVSTMFEFGSSHAMPIGTNPGLPETAILQLPPSLCQKIIQAVKSRLGPGYTITHLGQAATLLTLLKLSPLPKEALTNKSVIMPLPVNGRRYLREEVANMQYGSCQACAVVVFDNLAQYAIDFGDRDAVVEALIEAMKVTKTAYDYWLNKPYLLPLGLAKDNFFSALMESNESIPDGKAVPIIASDGLNDLYIPSTVLTQDGSPILDVDDVIFLTDTYEPGILLRMEGWNGTTSLSLSYSDGSFSSEEAKAFLQCMEEFMMSFVT
ncbi:putative trichothecene 15-O-acetyltransferase [Aureobasidium melanogenum CBS 110374]|uniref:Putative trichothecene 15-O-acetyltransferase n=1 Tax=Aureobasidium melanogenum (strain CBS 110374) TaxID=1043003 RepID=A0A074VZ22_AURM1|nr:putative trichothecene 15-O-acetyltransferase [Aureobasidium melanogenum CBS 110374]KEQ64524.1 putative trichothecene 15-O-acetyltransferase [Aureobasidium melanogenum CBS 110374]